MTDFCREHLVIIQISHAAVLILYSLLGQWQVNLLSNLETSSQQKHGVKLFQSEDAQLYCLAELVCQISTGWMIYPDSKTSGISCRHMAKVPVPQHVLEFCKHIRSYLHICKCYNIYKTFLPPLSLFPSVFLSFMYFSLFLYICISSSVSLSLLFPVYGK